MEKGLSEKDVVFHICELSYSESGFEPNSLNTSGFYYFDTLAEMLFYDFIKGHDGETICLANAIEVNICFKKEKEVK